MKVMTKEHNFIQIDLGGAPNQYTIAATQSSWSQPYPPQGVFMSQEYFDLAGLSQREKTLFFKGATVQQMSNPNGTSLAAGDTCVVVDVMCSSPMTDNQLNAFAVYGNFAAGSGVANSGLTFDQTVYGRIRSYAVSVDLTAWGSMILVSDDQVGSMNPTASDRIYSYRYVFVELAGTNKTLNVSNARHILSAEAREEPEFEYLMRLKRSYDLQQSYDED